MRPELRALAGQAAKRSRSRLRAQGCDWAGPGVTGDLDDAHFAEDAQAIHWLQQQQASGRESELRRRSALSRFTMETWLQVSAQLEELVPEQIGTELIFRLENHFVVYPDGGKAFPPFSVTTQAMRALSDESKSFARRFDVTLGQATVAIMTGRLPEARGRSSSIDERLDRVLMAVLRAMKDDGRPFPGPGRPGRDSGLTAYWEEAWKRFNKSVSARPDLSERKAQNWTTTRSRFKVLCKRDPEFKEEIGG